jgi:hypothetical protein
MSATKYFETTQRIDQAVLKLVTLEAVATMERNATSSELMACVVARSELLQLVNELRAELLRDAGLEGIE